MRLVVFDDFRIGVLDGDGIRDVSLAVPSWSPGDVYAMNRLVAGWDTLRSAIEQAAKTASPRAVDQVHLQPPIPAPTHLLAAPVNFAAHQAEMQAQGFRGGNDGSRRRDTADTLGFFMKATGSISGPNDPIQLPVKDYPDRRFDHEGEIAFVIGKPARGVSPQEAERYIFGYTIMIDATLRASEDRSEERVQRKSFASFSPMGPCVTTVDEVGDWRALNVKLWLNGELRQDAHPSDMIVDIPNLLSRASHIMPLRPGDVYTTGSPPGVGRIAPGDTVVVEESHIGRMTLPVVARDW